MSVGAPLHTGIALPTHVYRCNFSDRFVYATAKEEHAVLLLDLSAPQGGVSVVKFPARCDTRHTSVVAVHDQDEMMLWFLDRNAGVRFKWTGPLERVMLTADAVVITSSAGEAQETPGSYTKEHSAFVFPLLPSQPGACPSEVQIASLPLVTPRLLLRSLLAKVTDVHTLAGAHAHWPLFRVARALPYALPRGRRPNPTSEPTAIPWEIPTAK